MTTRFAILFLCLMANPIRGVEILFDFNSVTNGSYPAGFISVVGGQGSLGQWKMLEDTVPSALVRTTARAPESRRPVLAQVSEEAIDERFPMLIYTNVITADFTFSTRFKCVGGQLEQMAGIVFRYLDEKNYYYVRASAKGNTFRFFKVVDGVRSDPIGPVLPIATNTWHEIKVTCTGNRINCFLNDVQVIPTATDNSLQSGQVGFWTKSDSVSYFTDARLDYKPIEPLARKILKSTHEKYPRVRALRIYAKPADKAQMEVIASTRPDELGMPAAEAEINTLEKDSPYFGRLKPGVVVTLPLHDRNGEVVGVLRVEMQSFFGQTEGNAVARALPIARDIELQIIESKDLF